MGEKPEIRFLQLYDIQYNPPPYCIDFYLVGKNIRKWKATIIGPQDTPFENGKFKLSIDIPSNFPKKPPKVTFDTKIYHPNIDSKGNIYLDILNEQNWTRNYTMSDVLVAIYLLLTFPNPEDPLKPESEIALLFKNKRDIYTENAKKWTDRYAKRWALYSTAAI